MILCHVLVLMSLPVELIDSLPVEYYGNNSCTVVLLGLLVDGAYRETVQYQGLNTYNAKYSGGYPSGNFY